MQTIFIFMREPNHPDGTAIRIKIMGWEWERRRSVFRSGEWGGEAPDFNAVGIPDDAVRFPVEAEDVERRREVVGGNRDLRLQAVGVVVRPEVVGHEYDVRRWADPFHDVNLVNVGIGRRVK